MQAVEEKKFARRSITYQDWLDEAKALFGENPNHWKFECVMCKTPQTMADFVAAGVPVEKVERAIGFSCIGRFVKDKGCDWTLGGLLHVHTLEVIHPEHADPRPVFEFCREVAS